MVTAATEEKGMPHTTQIECPPPPLPSGGTTASSQASTPSTQPIRMTDPLASPSQSPPSPSRLSPSSLSPDKSESHDNSWGSVGDDVLLDATQKMEEDAASAVELFNSSQLDKDTPAGIMKTITPGPAASPISTEKAQIKQERQRGEFVSKEEERLCALNVIPETEWTYQRSEEGQAKAQAEASDSKSVTEGGDGAASGTSKTQSDSEPQGPGSDSEVTKGPAAGKERRPVQLGDHVIVHAFWAKITSLSPARVTYYHLKNASNPAVGWVLNTVEHEFDPQEVEEVIDVPVLVDETKKHSPVKFVSLGE